MKGLLSNFDTSLILAVVITVGGLGVAALIATRSRGSGRLWLPSVARTLTAGAVMVTFVATALPRSAGFEFDGDVVLMPGRGDSVTSIKSSTTRHRWRGCSCCPTSALAPVAFFACFGWYQRRPFVLAECLGLSVFVETMQALFGITNEP